MKRDSLRKVVLTTHGDSIKGYFHKFTDKFSFNTSEVEVHAVVENEEGVVNLVDLSYYTLKFLS